MHRDICAQFLKDCRISKGISVETECQGPKTSKPCLDMAGVMLPHLLFSNIFNHYPDQFDKIFGVEDLDSFRRGVEYVSDDRFMAHPICLDKRTGVAKGKVQDKSLTIPLFLHADGVEYQQRDSFLVWNWGGFLNAYSSLTSHFLIAAFPKSCTIHDKTWKPLMLLLLEFLHSLPCIVDCFIYDFLAFQVCLEFRVPAFLLASYMGNLLVRPLLCFQRYGICSSVWRLLH